ncbi:MAG: hypothetical protein JWN34_270 [Bryobacterales bacterium]|nr:hypothetical protein [Bryobacterales bacterium]
MDFEDVVEKEEPYAHTTHCSRCYAEFLNANDDVGPSGVPKENARGQYGGQSRSGWRAWLTGLSR